MTVRITHAGQSVDATDETWQAVADRLISESRQPWNPANGSRIERIESIDLPTPAAPAPDTAAGMVAAAIEKGVSDFGGGLLKDQDAIERIERIDAALDAAGLGKVKQDRQRYDRGTRMAEIGYQNQAGRKVAFDGLATVRDEIERGVATIKAERRKDVRLTAGEVASGLAINGKLTWNGLRLQEQAIRGLLSRIESPALRYVLGLRDRIIQAATALKDGKLDLDRSVVERGLAADKDALLDVLVRECRRFASEPVMFRTREGLGDVFTTTSQDYTAADFDMQARLLSQELPGDAKGFWRYDPATTRWELQSQVWTPTPVAEQAVGEPFRGYSSVKGGDAGLTSIWGDGGMEILACLNAGTFHQDFAGTGRRSHRGDVMRDLRKIVRDSIRAIDVLVNAWGQARATVIERPTTKDGGLIPIETAIPGFYRAMLTARQGVLVGRLPGRTENHVSGLARAYAGERRNPGEITRADLAQGYTKYIQTQPTAVRLDAESAIGRWIVNPKGEPLSYVAA